MRGFSSHDDDRRLEQELFEARSLPRQEFVDDIVLQVESTPIAERASRRPRLGAALAFAVVVIVGMAAFGGVGYAKTSIVSAVDTSKHAVAAAVKSDQKPASKTTDLITRSKSNVVTKLLQHDKHENRPSVHQYSRFVLVCYRTTVVHHHHTYTIYVTLVVPRELLSYYVPAHATLGACHH